MEVLMKRRILAIILSICTLLCCCPLPALGADATVYDTTGGSIRNSDVEACEGNWFYFVDSEKESFLYRRTLNLSKEEYLTDFPVDQIIARGTQLYLSAGSCLKLYNLSTKEQEELLTVTAEIQRFALSGSSLYYLTEGRLFHYDLDSKECSPLPLREDLKQFWLEAPDTLAFMADEQTTCYFDLLSGDILSAPVFYSEEPLDLGAPGDSLNLTALRAKFPHGKYWNHMPNMGTGPKYNNQDGWTEEPCPTHRGYCGTYMQTCNGFAPSGGTELSWQCMGYAEKCGFDMTGYNPRSNANGWQTYYSSSALNDLKPGDIVRYRYDRHSIYVTAVVGDTVTYTDCNSDDHCMIRWDATVSKSTLKTSFTHVRSAPKVAPSHANIGESFYAFLRKADTQTHIEAAADRNVQLAAGGNDPQDPKQIWHFGRQTDGSYIIRNAYSGLYLTAAQGGSSSGTNIQVSEGTGAQAQRWFLHSKGAGYTLSPAHDTSLVMDVEGNSNEPNTNVRLYEPNDTGAQVFSVYDLLRDGVSYSKPDRPEAPQISSIEYSDGDTVKISWTASPIIGNYDIRQYELQIFKGAATEGSPYASATALTEPSYTVELPKGIYTILLTAINTRYSDWSTTAQPYTTTVDPCKEGHSMSYRVSKEPSPMAEGVLTGSCSRCDKENLIPLPKLNTVDYSYQILQASSCTEEGKGLYTWNNTTYGSFSFEVPLPETSHNYTVTVVKATCTQQGYTTYACRGCGEGYTDNYVDPLGHAFDYKVRKVPTETEEGTLEGICSRCKESGSLRLPLLDQENYICTVLRAPSCTEAGLGAYTWKVTEYGSFSFEAELPPLGHDFIYTVSTQPTKTDTGLISGSCRQCAEEVTVSMPVLNLADYSYSILQPASCTEGGITRYIWNNSDYGRISFEAPSPPNGHRHKPEIIKPTCTEQGYTTYICVDCKDSYDANFVKALGHKESDWEVEVAPTCTAAGSRHTICLRCECILQREPLAATGHSWDDGVILQSPTETESGIISYSCTFCPECRTETIPPKGSVQEPLCDLGESCPSKHFTDVPNGAHWAHRGIDFALEQGLFNGTGKTTFSPDAPMTRAMLVTVLWRYAGQPEEGELSFSDVAENVWYAKAVAWAAHNGVVNGVGKDRFHPEGKITREQLATILYRYAQSQDISTEDQADLSSFPDGPSVSGYATQALSWAVAQELITGSKQGSTLYLRPQGEATRAQVASILMRFIQAQQTTPAPSDPVEPTEPTESPNPL